MKILDAGHEYLVDGYDGGKEQPIVFMKREGKKYPYNKGKHGGTNCQEVLRVLIDRTEYLNKQVPSAKTEASIQLLKTVLLLFESRAAELHDIYFGFDSLQQLVSERTCNKCGHVRCNCDEN